MVRFPPLSPPSPFVQGSSAAVHFLKVSWRQDSFFFFFGFCSRYHFLDRALQVRVVCCQPPYFRSLGNGGARFNLSCFFQVCSTFPPNGPDFPQFPACDCSPFTPRLGPFQYLTSFSSGDSFQRGSLLVVEAECAFSQTPASMWGGPPLFSLVAT